MKTRPSLKAIPIFTVALLLFSFVIKAQHSAARSDAVEKNVFNGNLLGTSSVVGISYERFLTKRATMELGIGLVGVGAGFSYYLIEPQPGKLAPYIGAKVSTAVLVDVGGAYVGYLPVGFTFFTKWRMNFGVDIGPAHGYLMESDFGGEMGETYRIPFYGNLRLGLRFSD